MSDRIEESAYTLRALDCSLSGWCYICKVFGFDPCKVVQIDMDVNHITPIFLERDDDK